MTQPQLSDYKYKSGLANENVIIHQSQDQPPVFYSRRLVLNTKNFDFAICKRIMLKNGVSSRFNYCWEPIIRSSSASSRLTSLYLQMLHGAMKLATRQTSSHFYLVWQISIIQHSYSGFPHEPLYECCHLISVHIICCLTSCFKS